MAGEDPEANGAGGQTGSCAANKRKAKFDSTGFEDWSSSFEAVLCKAVEEVDRIPVIPEAPNVPNIPFVITDTFVLSSIPEERELLHPTSAGLTYGLTGALLGMWAEYPIVISEDEAEEEDQMEGIEPGQPSQAQVHTGVAGASHGEDVAGEDEGVTNAQDAEYVHDGG